VARPASRAVVAPLPANPTWADKRRRVRQEIAALGNFACYITQYPHLVAGPIIRFQELEPQLLHRSHMLGKFGQGVFFFALGLAKKVLIADTVAGIADATFDAAALGPGTAWFGVIAYAFQIYFDFSGYSDMAIGLGLIHGFEFPRNFDGPYRSRSITEFWRRWHMTLSAWLRDFLYIPLGGNRRGRGRTYLNLMLVMLLGGLWHGAAWKYVVWGGIHGGWLALERFAGFEKRFARLPAWVKIVVTFMIVNLAWVFFRADTLRAAIRYVACMFGLGGDIPPVEALVRVEAYTLNHVLWMLIGVVIVFFGVQTWDLAKRITAPRAAFAIALFLWSIYTLTLRSSVPFLYFQF
jgi:alginate O-acetyltransferase complex protein AlgI